MIEEIAASEVTTANTNILSSQALLVIRSVLLSILIGRPFKNKNKKSTVLTHSAPNLVLFYGFSLRVSVLPIFCNLGIIFQSTLYLYLIAKPVRVYPSVITAVCSLSVFCIWNNLLDFLCLSLSNYIS